ncbi:MAG: zinc ribbon domain-containing protein [Ruthenibacterium sp.]
MFCKNCGKEMQDGDVFCKNCGTKVSERIQPEPETALQNLTIKPDEPETETFSADTSCQNEKAAKVSPHGIKQILKFVAVVLIVVAIIVASDVRTGNLEAKQSKNISTSYLKGYSETITVGKMLHSSYDEVKWKNYKADGANYVSVRASKKVDSEKQTLKIVFGFDEDWEYFSVEKIYWNGLEPDALLYDAILEDLYTQAENRIEEDAENAGTENVGLAPPSITKPDRGEKPGNSVEEMIILPLPNGENRKLGSWIPYPLITKQPYEYEENTDNNIDLLWKAPFDVYQVISKKSEYPPYTLEYLLELYFSDGQWSVEEENPYDELEAAGTDDELYNYYNYEGEHNGTIVRLSFELITRRGVPESFAVKQMAVWPKKEPNNMKRLTTAQMKSFIYGLQKLATEADDAFVIEKEALLGTWHWDDGSEKENTKDEFCGIAYHIEKIENNTITIRFDGFSFYDTVVLSFSSCGRHMEVVWENANAILAQKADKVI